MTLADYITANLGRKFVWGEWDCVLAAHGWAKQSTGIDYLVGIPTWTNTKDAMRMVKEHGGMEAILDARLSRINPNLAQDGDIALRDGCMCLYSGAQIVGPSESGLIFAPRTEAEAAWQLA